MGTRPESVYHGRDPTLLEHLIAFYGVPKARVLDVTANRRRMWAGLDTSRTVFVDIDPAMQPDVVADFRALPFADASFDVLVFDPPHLPSAAASPASLVQMRDDYGLEHGGRGPATVFRPFLQEAARVLRADGVVLAKIKDYVHNHAYQWTLVDWITSVRVTPGLTPCDLRIKIDPCGGNLKSGRWVRAHHARVVHTWWAVVRKGRCEARCRKGTVR